jgi:tyrosyl-tRNA synthetase
MSKSLGNYIGVTEPPEEIYGKTLRLPDSAMGTWYELLLGGPAPPELAARDAKRALARALVERFHGADAAVEAEARFDRIHIEGSAPDDVEDAIVTADNGQVHVPALVADLFGMSRSEARRLQSQGGVKLDGEPLGAEELDLAVDRADGALLQVGRRRFRRLRIA